MNILVFLIPLALLLGLGGLAVFLWALRTGQFDDLDGDALRILDDTHDKHPIDDPVDGPIGGPTGGKDGSRKKPKTGSSDRG